MKRRSRGGAKKEKVIMALSSVFVLSALTVTGFVIREKGQEQNDGYVVDFSTIENESAELAKNEGGTIQEIAETPQAEKVQGTEESPVTADDLDYDPYFQETNSLNVENGQMEEQMGDLAKADAESDKDKEKNEKGEEGMINESAEAMDEESTSAEVARMEEMEDTLAIATSTSIQPALTFGDEDTLAWPIVGNVLINYSMDKTVYFPTLEQYKYNPAIMISAVEGETITAAANGKVNSIYTDPELGNVVVMELGNGYEITYGQLKDITVSEGGFVNQGDIIGSVAAPTKYYVVEGCNVYFKLTKDGVAVNPMTKLQ